MAAWCSLWLIHLNGQHSTATCQVKPESYLGLTNQLLDGVKLVTICEGLC